MRLLSPLNPHFNSSLPSTRYFCASFSHFAAQANRMRFKLKSRLKNTNHELSIPKKTSQTCLTRPLKSQQDYHWDIRYSSRLKWCNLVQGRWAFLIHWSARFTVESISIWSASYSLTGEARIPHQHKFGTGTCLGPTLQSQFCLAESDISFFGKGGECCLTLYKGKWAEFKGKPRCSLCLKNKTQKQPLKALQ